MPEPLPGKAIKPQQECSKQKIPRPVTLVDIKTGEITLYPSLYRAGRSLKDLRELMKQNGIKGGCMMIKLIDLREKQLLPETLPGKPIKPQQECSKQKIPTCNFRRHQNW